MDNVSAHDLSQILRKASLLWAIPVSSGPFLRSYLLSYKVEITKGKPVMAFQLSIFLFYRRQTRSFFEMPSPRQTAPQNER